MVKFEKVRTLNVIYFPMQLLHSLIAKQDVFPSTLRLLLLIAYLKAKYLIKLKSMI